MGRLGETEDVPGRERDACGVQESLGLFGRGAEGCSALFLQGAADDRVVGEGGLAKHVVGDVHGGGSGGRFGNWRCHCSGGGAGGYGGLASTAHGVGGVLALQLVVC
jgi:hypothetical protein